MPFASKLSSLDIYCEHGLCFLRYKQLVGRCANLELLQIVHTALLKRPRAVLNQKSTFDLFNEAVMRRR